MPRRQDRWSDLPAPATPLQRGTYLDACTAWLIAAPDADTAHELETPTSDPLQHETTGCDDVVARSMADRGVPRRWLCIVCRSEVSDAAPRVGNPFAQHCLVVTCAACRTTHS